MAASGKVRGVLWAIVGFLPLGLVVLARQWIGSIPIGAGSDWSSCDLRPLVEDGRCEGAGSVGKLPAQLWEMASDYRIIAVGEYTHGSAEPAMIRCGLSDEMLRAGRRVVYVRELPLAITVEQLRYLHAGEGLEEGEITVYGVPFDHNRETATLLHCIEQAQSRGGVGVPTDNGRERRGVPQNSSISHN